MLIIKYVYSYKNVKHILKLHVLYNERFLTNYNDTNFSNEIKDNNKGFDTAQNNLEKWYIFSSYFVIFAL